MLRIEDNEDKGKRVWASGAEGVSQAADARGRMHVQSVII